MECRCPVCGQYFDDYEDLEEHLDDQHDLTLAEANKLALDDAED